MDTLASSSLQGHFQWSSCGVCFGVVCWFQGMERREARMDGRNNCCSILYTSLLFFLFVFSAIHRASYTAGSTGERNSTVGALIRGCWQTRMLHCNTKRLVVFFLPFCPLLALCVFGLLVLCLWSLEYEEMSETLEGEMESVRKIGHGSFWDALHSFIFGGCCHAASVRVFLVSQQWRGKTRRCEHCLLLLGS